MALNQVGLERLNTATTDKIGTNKNIIINGSMQVAQRGTSSTSTGFGSVDRFQISYSGTDEAPTQAQASVASGTTPFETGLSKAFKITNGDQSGGAGASDHIHISYSIEDQDLATSGWNYKSSSSYVTLSFYVKSSIAQNFYFYLQSDNGSQFRYVMETGSLSADTWTKITKTIPGNSNIVLNSDNGIGMYIVYSLFDGTDRTGTRPLNAWAALDNTSRTPDQTSTWYTTNDSTWEITGVQLEVGDTATSFEHRSFTEELTRCYRYYRRFGANGSLPTPAPYNRFSIGYSPSSADVRFPFQLDPPMRINPVNSNFSKSGSFAIQPGSIGSYTLTCDDNSCSTNMMIALMGSTSVSSGTGSAVSLHANNDTSANIEISAEL